MIVADQETIASLDPDIIVAQMGVFVFTTNGIVIAGDPSYDEWHDTVLWVQKVGKHSPFWRADLLLYGEAKYGEKYTQAVEATGKQAGTLMTEVWVAKAVPVERRREELTFAHHQEVAALDADEQTQWLDTAVTEDLSAKELRQQIKVAKAQAEGKALEYWLDVRCETAQQQEQLQQQLANAGHVVHAHTRAIG